MVKRMFRCFPLSHCINLDFSEDKPLSYPQAALIRLSAAHWPHDTLYVEVQQPTRTKLENAQELKR